MKAVACFLGLFACLFAALSFPKPCAARRATSSFGAREAILAGEPVAFGQTAVAARSGFTLENIPCTSIGTEGEMRRGDMVKLTVASLDATEGFSLEVSSPVTAEGGDPSYKHVAQVACRGKGENGPTCQLLTFGGRRAEVTDIEVPVRGHNLALMAVCIGEETSLRCTLYFNDNGGNDGWKSTSFVVPLGNHRENLTFTLLGQKVLTPKSYASGGMKVSRANPILGCERP